MGSLGTLEDYLNEAANMRHNSGLYERPDITVITTMIGMAEDRLGEANDKSFPDPLEGFGWDIRRQAVQAWEERIGAVKRDLQNTPDKISIRQTLQVSHHHAIDLLVVVQVVPRHV